MPADNQQLPSHHHHHHPPSNNSGGSDESRSSPPTMTTAHHHTLSPSSDLMPSSCYPITLKFVDVCYRVKLTSANSNTKSTTNLKQIICGNINPTSSETTQNLPPTNSQKTILHGITGVASPGEVLAVLGPSGSGKSTLLNALAGRALTGTGLTGSIQANDKKLTKSVLRRTGFVAQDDCLYPHLTVRETLVFCALLRLPGTLTRKEKVSVAESVIVEMGLVKCANTVIGNSFVRGVSGGERKRVSIAHEMLLNPSLLILDEPTSGLDSTAAFGLASKLVAMAKRGGKTVVASMHQPSSRVYQTFDRVLLLSEGTPLYFGSGSEAMRYFESVGLSPSFPMNPADFLLDLANGIFNPNGSSNEKDNQPNTVRQSLITSYNTHLYPAAKSFCLLNPPPPTPNPITVVGKRQHHNNHHQTLSTHITTWFDHFTLLFNRSLKERRHESFNSLRVLQVIAASLLAGTMWFRSDPHDIQDRLGLLFFISIFWGVFPSFNASFAFPQDRVIFLKERASGMYSLSPYFMARIVGDLPMELILPTVFLTLVYLMTGLRPGLAPFLLSLLVVLGYVMVAQGLGLAVGAIIMDAKRASTVVTVTMLAFVLTGGFYVHNIPPCLGWVKYVSVTYYCYRLLIGVQYGEGERVWSLLGCDHQHNHHNVGGSSSSSSTLSRCKFVEEDVMGQISPLASVGVMLIMFVGYRLIAYIALKRIRV